MKIKLKYFGMVAETIGKQEESVNVNENIEISNLQALLEEKYHQLDKINYKIAVNRSIGNDNILLKEEDEVAILPPFAGG